MPVELTTRASRIGDETAILDLFARSFPHDPRPLEHFVWKYRQNPWLNEKISLTFDEGQRLVGHYAGYGVPFAVGARDVLAYQIGDTMTDVSVRHIGRGPTSVLGRTALHFYRHFCEGQIAFNFGFNVANIQKFSLRFLRSDRVEPVSYRVAKPPAPVGRFERRLSGYSLEVVDETGPEWDTLFRRVRPAYQFLVRRDAAWVRWRYLTAPGRPYVVVAIRKWRQLVGWIVFRIRDGRFVWGDALVHPEYPGALGIALRHMVPLYPVDRIEAWYPPRPRWFHLLLEELGFELRPEPQDLSLMCVPFTWTDVIPAMRERLYYSWGDSDLF
jgi:hypothetical protein